MTYFKNLTSKLTSKFANSEYSVAKFLIRIKKSITKQQTLLVDVRSCKRGWRWVRRATLQVYSSTLGRARQRRRFVQIVATVARHARLMYSYIKLRSLSTNLRRAERPCGGCWGCSPQRCALDAVSNRTLGSPTAMWSSCGSTKSCTCSTACARHRTCGRNVHDEWVGQA